MSSWADEIEEEVRQQREAEQKKKEAEAAAAAAPPAAAPAADAAKTNNTTTAAAATATPAKDDEPKTANSVDKVSDAVEGLKVGEHKSNFEDQLKSAFVFEADADKIKVQQADPNSPLYSVKTFEDLAHLPDTLPIPDVVMNGIKDMGYVQPSRIQEKALPLLLQKKATSLIFQAQAGTGKTAAFTITLLSRIDFNLKEPQAIITAPTFLLCQQIGDVIEKMAKHCNITVEVHYSTVNYSQQHGHGHHRHHKGPAMLQPGEQVKAHVLIATPKKLEQYLNPRNPSFDPRKVRVLILDEADNLLEADFKSNALRIKNSLKAGRGGNLNGVQVILCSATFNENVMNFAKSYVPAPYNAITLPVEKVSVENVKQLYVICDGDAGKFQALGIIYSTVSLGQTLIFVARKDTARYLRSEMANAGHNVAILTGDLDKEEQAKALTRFRDGDDKVLITTNILARGIDVEKISMVVNYDIPINLEHPAHPPDYETYLHRCGRSGRFGKKGTALTLVDGNIPSQLVQIKQLSQYWGREIQPLTMDEDDIEKNVAAG